MHWGIVLAAGASSRMGSPKALLKTPEGIPLALHQLKLLESAGCGKTAIVLGSEAERISAELPGVHIILNPDWESGRPSSILAALKNATSGDGIFILPVDTVGIRAETSGKFWRPQTQRIIRPSARSAKGFAASWSGFRPRSQTKS